MSISELEPSEAFARTMVPELTVILPIDVESRVRVGHLLERMWQAAQRIAAGILLLLLLPLLLVIALAVRLDSPGGSIFRQVRVGQDGRRFVILKFRSMRVDAELALPTLRHLNEYEGVLFKVRSDPRITRLGRLLRRSSLDELPQLWNVVKGDMALVGPRPPLPSEVEEYALWERRRLSVKPGMTGLWQVSGRSDLPWDEAARLDVHYAVHRSMGLDLEILLRTFGAVISGRGAY